MATEHQHTWQYIGATAQPKGTLMKMHTVAGQCDVATAVTDIPCGVLLEDCAIGSVIAQNVGIGSIEGEVYKVVGSTTIAIKALLGATAAGKAVTVTFNATYANKWIFGVALTAAGAGGTDIVEMRYGPQIVGQ